jgi:hypothetical protein
MRLNKEIHSKGNDSLGEPSRSEKRTLEKETPETLRGS